MDNSLPKLGKRPAIHDDRTIKMASLFKKRVKMPPLSYNFDEANKGCDTPMFLNDVLGDCVIAGRAHMTRRLELIEQGSVINVSDDEVKRQYFSETGGNDSGLNMLKSLKCWRKSGWIAAKSLYYIHAFASIATSNKVHIAKAIYHLSGVYAGFDLPVSAQKQIGSVWKVTTGKDSVAGSWGGHCIYIYGYNKDGLECVTWGARQKMTWDWFNKYCDEAYGVVDSIDKWMTNTVLDVDKLENVLQEIAY